MEQEAETLMKERDELQAQEDEVTKLEHTRQEDLELTRIQQVIHHIQEHDPDSPSHDLMHEVKRKSREASEVVYVQTPQLELIL